VRKRRRGGRGQEGGKGGEGGVEVWRRMGGVPRGREH